MEISVDGEYTCSIDTHAQSLFILFWSVILLILVNISIFGMQLF